MLLLSISVQPFFIHEGRNDVIEEAIQELKVRNESFMVITDNDPQVFQFLSMEEKADALKGMDHVYEEVYKKKPSIHFKHFPAREAAWHIASLYSSFSMSRPVIHNNQKGEYFNTGEESSIRKSSSSSYRWLLLWL